MSNDGDEMHADTPTIDRGSKADAGKVRLLTLDQLDGRTRAAQLVSQTISAVISDLGGDEHVSIAERQIVQRAALTGAMLTDLGVRWLSGGAVDPGLYATLANTERRLLETVGLRRRLRDIAPSKLAGLIQGHAE
jgi:hypothetical protein